MGSRRRPEALSNPNLHSHILFRNRTLHTRSVYARQRFLDMSGGMHAGAKVPVGPDPGGAAARWHERRAVQLLTRLARLPSGACGSQLCQLCLLSYSSRNKRTRALQFSRCWVHLKRRLSSAGCHIFLRTTLPLIGAGDPGYAAESHGQHTHYVRGHARHEGTASSGCECCCAYSKHQQWRIDCRPIFLSHFLHA